MSIINPLIFIPSPRDIAEFKKAVNKLTFDKLWIKYYPQYEAYFAAREWFLYHKEYTHLIVLPDDLLVTQDDLDLLLIWMEDPVISGWCPHLDTGKHANVSYKVSPNPPHTGTFDKFEFIPIADLPDDIIQIKHTGFAPTVIPRDIVERIPFRTDEECCVDNCFSLDLDAQGIKQYCDTRVRTKNVFTTLDMIQVGKKEKDIIFETKAV